MNRPLPLLIIAIAVTANVALVLFGLKNWDRIERYFEARELDAWMDEVMTDESWVGLESYYEFAEARTEQFYNDMDLAEEALGATLWSEDNDNQFLPQAVLDSHTEVRDLRNEVAADLVGKLVPYLASLETEQRDAVIWSLYFHDDFPLIF